MKTRTAQGVSELYAIKESEISADMLQNRVPPSKEDLEARCYQTGVSEKIAPPPKWYGYVLILILSNVIFGLRVMFRRRYLEGIVWLASAFGIYLVCYIYRTYKVSKALKAICLPIEIHPEDADLVREKDLKWWNRLTLDDVDLLQRNDIFTRLTIFEAFKDKKGLTDMEAGKQVRRGMPYYYMLLTERADEVHAFSGNDAKLPYPIKDRVNRGVNTVISKMMREDIKQASSFNALVRQLIRSGKI